MYQLTINDVVSDDLTLDGRILAEMGLDGSKSAGQAEFESFVFQNVDIVRACLAHALDVHHAGLAHYGISEVAGWVRYYTSMHQRNSTFKINHNIRARLARLLMRVEPELEGFFETRMLKS